MKVPTPNAQVHALDVALCELAKMLGRNQLISVTQLASALETAAKASTTSAESGAALAELAHRLRNP